MRVALGDVTPTVSMLLPSLGPALPGTPSYSGGLTGFKRLGRFRGLGQACTQWTSPDGNACAIGDLGTMEDVSTGTPCTCSSTAPACLPQGSYGPLQPGQVYCPTTTPTTTTGISTTTIIAGVAVIAVIFAMMARR